MRALHEKRGGHFMNIMELTVTGFYATYENILL